MIVFKEVYKSFLCKQSRIRIFRDEHAHSHRRKDFDLVVDRIRPLDGLQPADVADFINRRLIFGVHDYTIHAAYHRDDMARLG